MTGHQGNVIEWIIGLWCWWPDVPNETALMWPCVQTVTMRYPSWFDFRCCKDKPPTNNFYARIFFIELKYFLCDECPLSHPDMIWDITRTWTSRNQQTLTFWHHVNFLNSTASSQHCHSVGRIGWVCCCSLAVSLSNDSCCCSDKGSLASPISWRPPKPHCQSQTYMLSLESDRYVCSPSHCDKQGHTHVIVR